ncbi:MAG: CatA-like O-acetyltransferase [Bacteroidota bacterium]
MKILDIDTWNRKQHFEHFNAFHDPYFGVSFKVDVTDAYIFSKDHEISFFSKYLHACMKAINDIENLKYRIEKDNIVIYDIIHASAAILRPDHTFGLTFIPFDDDVFIFNDNVKKEKDRVLSSTDFFPPVNSNDCIHCSSIPWVNFTGHKEPYMGVKDSVPKLAFSQVETINQNKQMTVAINVNHALADGYHVGLFKERFQFYLNA